MIFWDKYKNRPDLVISDLHAPYHHRYAITFVKYIYKHFNCRTLIINGDLYDFHAISHYTKVPGTPSKEKEFERAREFAKELTYSLKNGVFIRGNHDIRPESLAIEAGLLPEMLKDPMELYNLHKSWRYCPLCFVIKDRDVLLEHEGSNGAGGALKTAIHKRCSFVQGHNHAEAGVNFSANHANVIFGMNTGCLCDNTALAMAYAKYAKKKGVLGAGLVYSSYRAEFIPMEA